MGRIMNINTFANECGYFLNGAHHTNSEENYGYNCQHVKSDNYNKEKGYGNCLSSTCPLARPATITDIERQTHDYQWQDADCITRECAERHIQSRFVFVE